MEEQQTVIFPSATRNDYTFNVYQCNEPLTFCGIYLVLCRNAEGYSIIYIGRSGGLGLDLQRHPLNICILIGRGRHIMQHNKYVFKIGHGVYRIHNDAIPKHRRKHGE